jgi:2-polyprenyl-3-methyl-5-hydroxy-6-metoxy-1,4-benzoquinol methylase
MTEAPSESKFDKSNGYDQHAETFMRIRNRRIGPSTVLEWSRSLPPGCSILDLGCGNGVPISEPLIEAGFRIFGVDASPNMIETFRQRFPNAESECAAAEEIAFSGRTFDAVLAWGLLFLLHPDQQRAVIQKAASVLKPGGSFLFTASREPHRWNDSLTGQESISLGEEAYHQLLNSNGLTVTGHATDEGDNYYFSSVKSSAL